MPRRRYRAATAKERTAATDPQPPLPIRDRPYRAATAKERTAATHPRLPLPSRDCKGAVPAPQPQNNYRTDADRPGTSNASAKAATDHPVAATDIH